MFNGHGIIHPLVRTTVMAALLHLSNASSAIGIGELAPNFELRTIDGEVLHLNDYQGKKAVYLVFWNSWCSYCIRKAPSYNKLHEKFGDRVEIIAVNTTWSDSLEEIEQFQQRFGAVYTIAMDDGEALTTRFEVYKVPTEFIIDINGVIRYRDGVPEYLAAHIPDWFQPYTADMNPMLMCSK